MKEMINRAERMALDVDFLKTKEEYIMYIRALVAAQVWAANVK